jgi:DNA-binding MarR family transcriptional regulator
MQATAVSSQASDQAALARDLAGFVGFVMQTRGRDVMEIASEFDISLSQMKALHNLKNVPEPVTVKELGDQLGLSLAAMSRAADGLVQRGLVTRLEDTHDRRMKRLSLTRSGDQLVQKLRDARLAGIEEFVATLSPKERALLAKALDPIMARDDLTAFCGGTKKR